MKTKTMEQLRESIRDVYLDIENNWSAWGDASGYVRKRTVNKLKMVYRNLGKPLRIEILKKRSKSK